MSKEQISNFIWEILTQFFAKANIFFIAVGGSFIVLVNAYHIKKQTFWDSVFEMITGAVILIGFGKVIMCGLDRGGCLFSLMISGKDCGINFFCARLLYASTQKREPKITDFITPDLLILKYNAS